MQTCDKNSQPKTELLSIVLHDIQSPLRFIGTITQELAINCQSMDKEILGEHLKIVNSSIIALQNYCARIYAWQKKDNKVTNKNTTENINEIFVDIKSIYAPLIEFKKIKFNLVETKLLCFVQKEILFIIIINLIDNAYKYTNYGTITLEALLEENTILIVVSDTGKGMEQKTIEDIIENKIEFNQSTFGFYIINDLLKRINGSLKIISNKNVGTSVTISLLNPEKYDNAFQDS